ncbi:hypothetical protein, partial [Microbacterium foliorum]|uniref:hypothetical protein n=1 Tax=Microbacterium foliorum TaxID=104336 RepID=UPI001E54E811
LAPLAQRAGRGDGARSARSTSGAWGRGALRSLNERDVGRGALNERDTTPRPLSEERSDETKRAGAAVAVSA